MRRTADGRNSGIPTVRFYHEAVYQSTGGMTRHAIVAGHPYSILAWCARPGSSWALPVSVVRVHSHETDVAVGVRQVQTFCAQRGAALAQALHLVVADGKYGNHGFLGAVREESCGVLVRLRRDRVPTQAADARPFTDRPSRSRSRRAGQNLPRNAGWRMSGGGKCGYGDGTIFMLAKTPRRLSACCARRCTVSGSIRRRTCG